MADKKFVLVTGAAGGVGRATAQLFLDEGWQVLAVDVIKQPAPSMPSGVSFVSMDISNPTDVDKLFETFSHQINNGLHALVNNAAVQITKPLVETTVEEWDRVHAVNLRAPFLVTKSFYSPLKTGKGSVVNVSSVHALATSAEIGAYASTKGGLLALTRAMAIEFAGDGIRVNAVLPGATDTPMLEAGLTRDHVKGGGLQQRKKDLASKILLKRLAAPEEIARVIYFLADSAESGYVTGQSIVADGGALARLSIE
jgi:NAD(P)-dependent dehydrogenase (short-subunit alcohol dehydrogenase family)